jgi:hypothetical protein
MKTFAISLISSVCVTAALSWSQTSIAQTVPLLFQTTFNCPDWNQSMGLGDANVCSTGDGITGSGGWTSPGHPNGDEILAAANNPAGGGGKGFRHWVGDGLNSGGGGIVVSWTPTSELWFRYYVRFQSGFRWDPNPPGGQQPEMKQLYFNRNIAGMSYFGLKDGNLGGHIAVEAVNHYSSVSWNDWQGGSTGSGLWNCVELHMKMNSPATSSNGILEIWINGTKVHTNSAVQWTTTAGATFSNTAVGENHKYPLNGGDAYVDFDDIAISTTGYIGPIGSPGSGSAGPKNLRVQ